MKTEKELVVESLADLYRDMDKLDEQKDVGAIALRTGGYITLFNKYLAIAKKEYSEYPAITSIPEIATIQVQGIKQIPHLSGEAPPKFIATKLNIKAILNALNFDPSAPKTSQTTPVDVPKADDNS